MGEEIEAVAANGGVVRVGAASEGVADEPAAASDREAVVGLTADRTTGRRVPVRGGGSAAGRSRAARPCARC